MNAINPHKFAYTYLPTVASQRWEGLDLFTLFLHIPFSFITVDSLYRLFGLPKRVTLGLRGSFYFHVFLSVVSAERLLLITCSWTSFPAGYSTAVREGSLLDLIHLGLSLLTKLDQFMPDWDMRYDSLIPIIPIDLCTQTSLSQPVFALIVLAAVLVLPPRWMSLKNKGSSMCPLLPL